MKTIASDCYYIASNSELAQAADSWQHATVLGVDTEFIRVDTFYPIPALIQISDGKQCWLIDVLRIDDFSPLRTILTAPHIAKIIHAASEDLEVFDQLLGVFPTPLFDTQIAAALCGYGASVGYSRLVQELLYIELSKEQCRSDWLARPLSPEQLHYACLDVLYLPALYQSLQASLNQLQRSDWATEENTRQQERCKELRTANYNWEKINNAWRLNHAEQQRLWHLVLGRDALARQHNKSRNHIAKDFALLEIARRPPANIAALYGMEGLHPSAVRQFGTQLLQLAQKTPSDLVHPELPLPLSKAENDYVKKLRALTEQIANGLQLPAELLAKKLEMEQAVRHYLAQRPLDDTTLPSRFQGWRKNIVGTVWLDEMRAWS